MAIDGVKIIDSDSAHDIYNQLIEGYKNGENIEDIRKALLGQADEFCFDDLHTEIYWTAFAHALWKVGYPRDEVREKALQRIAGGAALSWDKIDAKARTQRQKALDKLAEQLATDNPKPLKKPRLPKTPKTPHFALGDVLAVETEAGYGICLVSAVDQTPRKIEYHLAPTRFLSREFPTIVQFLESKIACGMDNKTFALKTDCWFNHKDLGEILDKLTWIANVRLKPLELWVLSSAHTVEDIYDKIIEDEDYFGRKTRVADELVAEIVKWKE